MCVLVYGKLLERKHWNKTGVPFAQLTCSEWAVTICSLLSSSSVVLLLHSSEKASGVSDNKKPHPEEMQLPDFMPIQSKCRCHRNLPSSVFSFIVCCTNSFDQHMLYYPQSLVANAAHYLCWNIWLLKKRTLKWFPANKRWNECDLEPEYIKGLCCAYLSPCKHIQ